MQIVNTVMGLAINPSKKCQVCSVRQQAQCQLKVSSQLKIVKLELAINGFVPEQLGNGKSIEIGCHIFDSKLEN
jgi:hypothetical protein